MLRNFAAVAVFWIAGVAVADDRPSSAIKSEVAVLMQLQGEAAWKAWQKTASYEVFIDSGLVPALWRHAEQVIRQAMTAEDLKALEDEIPWPLVSAAARYLWTHGVTMAVGRQSTPDGDAPWVVLVVPDGAESYAVVKEWACSGNQSVPESVIEGRTVLSVENLQEGVSFGQWVEGRDLVLFYGFSLSAEKVVLPSVEKLLASAVTERLAVLARWPDDELPQSEGVDFVRLWIDFEQSITLLQKVGALDPAVFTGVAVDAVVAALGVDQWRALSFRIGATGRQVVQEWFLRSDKAPFQFVGWGELSVSLDQLPPLPADVASFSLQAVDLSRLDKQQCLQVISQVESLAASLAGLFGLNGVLEQQSRMNLGYREAFEQFFSRSQSILQHLEPAVCLYHDRAQQIVPGIVPVIAIRVRDMPGLVSALDGLGWTRDDRWGCPTYHQSNEVWRLHDASGLRSLLIASGNTDDTVSGGRDQRGLAVWLGTSTIAVCDGWLVWGVQPQFVRAFILRSQGRLPRWSLDTIPAECRQRIPARFTQITWADRKAEVEALVKFSPWAGDALQMITDFIASELPGESQEESQSVAAESATGNIVNRIPAVSPLDLPPVELVTAPLQPVVSVLSIDQRGTRRATYGAAFVCTNPTQWKILIAAVSFWINSL